MKTVEEIALAVCEKIGPVAMCKDPLAFSEMVVAAVDAERGEDAVAWVSDTGEVWGNGAAIKPGDKLFLSPTISLGFALVPIDPSEEWIAKVVRVNQPDLDIGCRAWREEVESLEYWHKAMIQAAGVTK